MALFTIADLHLPLGIDKPMDIFGAAWENYVERLGDNWQSVVGKDDTVVIPGDFSWATYIEQAYKDFDFIHNLNGTKIIVKGNHDYWWTTMSKLNQYISENGFHDISFLQNNCYIYNDIAICGTRGWIHPAWDNAGADDLKLFEREVNRLELSLAAADSREIYVFTHFPPMSDKCESNAFTDTLEKYNVSKCFYGHLHAHSHRNAVNAVVRGIEYRLVAGDYIAFNPLKICD